MGGQESKLKEQFLYAIVANKEGSVANFLKVRKSNNSHILINMMIDVSIIHQCTFS